MLSAKEIQARFLAFFEKNSHAVIPSASLVPENDPSVLFNTAGMQPLVPYLLGEKHPMGTRLVNIQKCVRTGDLDEVGDNTHFTLFFMMGNWSLGDYFKEDAIKWSHEFLTNKNVGLGLDVKRLYVTVFEGNDDAPLDNESKEIWMSLGIPENRIFTLGAKDNWWSPGDNGPCGPDTEMFYDLTENGLGDITKDEFIEHCDKQNIVEIWNDVFMEYEKKDGKVIGKLNSKNVDTGSGLERMTAVVQGVKTGYDTDLFTDIFKTINKHKTKDDTKAERIIADHIRASVFMIADGVLPANSDRGYIVRRLLRRATNYANNIGSANILINDTAKTVCEVYKDWLVSSPTKEAEILNTINDEVLKFEQTLERGMKEFLRGEDPFVLFTSYGFPIELTIELAKERNWNIDIDAFNAKMKAHQDLSRAGSEQKFKGGLANHNEQTIKLHTAHHLLLAALQELISPDIKQRGSNITEERLRMDFNFDRKITPEELKKVEDKVNEEIQKNLSVVKREMPLAEATALGAQMEFGAKYPETVSVYFIEDENGHAFSKEFCGGPHVENTNKLGIFKIQKEESVAAGIRRIKAVLL
jgi:alanyl-tRNA synthetase